MVQNGFSGLKSWQPTPEHERLVEHPRLLLGADFKYRFLGHRQWLSVF
jgi:hypothetical protein